jgi:hypothetical protein
MVKAAALAVTFPFTDALRGSALSRDDNEVGAFLHNVQLQNCPQACEYAGTDTATWTSYHSFDELALCEHTVLFTFNVHATIPDSHIKACSTTTNGPRMQSGAFYGLLENNVTETPTPEIIREMVAPIMPGVLKTSSPSGSCGASPQQDTLQIDKRWTGRGRSSTDHISSAVS